MMKRTMVFVVMLVVTVSARAANIPIVNASFEDPNISPAAQQGVNWHDLTHGWWFASGDLRINRIDDTRQCYTLSNWGWGEFWQDLASTETFQAGVSYTLSADFGNVMFSGNNAWLNQAHVTLLAQNPSTLAWTTVATITANGSGSTNVVPQGEWKTFNTSYTAPSELNGWKMRISADVYSGDNSNCSFDNIALTTPEPATIGLLMLGGLFLNRRK